MIARHIALVTAILLAYASPLLLAAGAPGAVQAGQPTGAGGSSLGFGSWKFTGKAKSGVVWTIPQRAFSRWKRNRNMAGRSIPPFSRRTENA